MILHFISSNHSRVDKVYLKQSPCIYYKQKGENATFIQDYKPQIYFIVSFKKVYLLPSQPQESVLVT